MQNAKHEWGEMRTQFANLSPPVVYKYEMIFFTLFMTTSMGIIAHQFQALFMCLRRAYKKSLGGGQVG